MSPRARALSPTERRAALVRATVPLLAEHGRAVTTRQIAQAAGVAEGTIFRVFTCKDALVDQAIVAALDLEPYVASMEALSVAGTLDEVVTAMADLSIRRFRSVFALMAAVGMVGPPPMHQHPDHWQERLAAAHRRLLAPHADELAVDPAELARTIRMLAFAGTNPRLNDGAPLTAAGLARLVLDGTRKACSCSGD